MLLQALLSVCTRAPVRVSAYMVNMQSNICDKVSHARLSLLCRLLERGHVAFVETVPFRVIAAFTVLQFLGLAAVYVVSSWTGVSEVQ